MSDKTLCPFCGSDKVYLARHDSDWGSGNSFTPMNDGLEDDMNRDIETNYCDDCMVFGDFTDVNSLVIQVREGR